MENWAFLVAQLVKNLLQCGDLGSTPGLGRAPGEGKGYPLQYSGLENSMKCIVHGVAKSQTRLSNFQKKKKKKHGKLVEEVHYLQIWHPGIFFSHQSEYTMASSINQDEQYWRSSGNCSLRIMISFIQDNCESTFISHPRPF